jgi:hypothetical protein
VLLLQVKLYEQPMTLNTGKDNGNPMGNHFVGSPFDFFKLGSNGSILTSDIPCGRNTHWNKGHTAVQETEQVHNTVHCTTLFTAAPTAAPTLQLYCP